LSSPSIELSFTLSFLPLYLQRTNTHIQPTTTHDILTHTYTTHYYPQHTKHTYSPLPSATY
jgi:hypothetical protein